MFWDSFGTANILFNLPKDMIFSNEGNEGNRLRLPYQLAQVYETKGKKYIAFYVFDANRGKTIRCKRAYENAKEAKKTIDYINEKLIAGFHVKKRPVEPIEATVLNAFQEIVEIRKKELAEASTKRDKSHFNQFSTYLIQNKLDALPVKELTKLHVIKFLDVRKADGVSNRTRNNALNWVRSILSALMERGYVENNVAKGISSLKETEAHSLAFTKEDANKLKEILKEENLLVYQFCMIIYLCFIRPKELRNLRVENVKLEENKIFVPSTISKSKKNRYILIPQKLKVVLEPLIKNKKPQAFLFDNGGKIYPINYFNQKFKDIARKHGFDERYYLYCWKHTGVTECMNNGAKLTFIQHQCGHSSIEDTALYVKGLGLATEDTNWDFSPDI